MVKVLRAIALSIGLLAASVTSAAANAPWVAPATLGPDGGMLPQVAMNAPGQGIAAWMGTGPSAGGVFVSEEQPLGAFGPPVRIGDGQYPQVAIGAGGDAVVSWPTRTNDLNVAVRAPGGGFGPVQPLTPVGASGDYCTPIPDVAVAPDGTAIVAWVEGGPCWTSNGRFQRRLRVAWRAPGGQFAEPQTVATWRSGIQDVGVAIDASDHATLLWASAGDPEAVTTASDAPAWGVWTATGDAAGFGPAVDLSGGIEHLSPGAAPEIALAGNERGDLVAVWTKAESYVMGGLVPPGGPDPGLIASIRRPGGGWSQAVHIPGAGPEFAHTPDVAVDALGNAAVAWNDACKIALAYAPAGGTFGESVTRGCTTEEGGAPGGDGKGGPADPAVGIDSKGRAIVSYGISRGDHDIAPMETIRYTPGSPHEAPYGISGAAGSRNIAPAIAFDGLGNGVVVWEGDDGPQPGSGYDSVRAIRIAQYDSEPPVLQYVEPVDQYIVDVGLGEPAKIAVTVERKVSCRRKGSHRRCVRYGKVGALKAAGKAGKNRIRLPRRSVRPHGAYRVKVAASDRAGNVKARTAGFRVR